MNTEHRESRTERELHTYNQRLYQKRPAASGRTPPAGSADEQPKLEPPPPPNPDEPGDPDQPSQPAEPQPGPGWRRRSIGAGEGGGAEHAPEPPSWRCGCGQPWPCLALADEIETEHRRDPEWTEQTLARLLGQAAADIGVPADALRHRFLPWSTDPARDCRHQLDRYRWDCSQCAAPWPCPAARVELAEAYAGDPLGLAELMGRLLVQAKPVADLPEAELTERFTGWVERWLAVPVDPLLLSPAGLHRWLVDRPGQRCTPTGPAPMAPASSASPRAAGHYEPPRPICTMQLPNAARRP